MMKTRLQRAAVNLSMLLMPLVAFPQAPGPESGCHTGVQGNTLETVCSLRHKGGLTSFHLRGGLSGDDPETAAFTPREVEFYRGDVSVQKIVVSIDPGDLNLSGLQHETILEWVDVNRDGYMDFRLMSQNLAPNPSYFVYIYDRLNQRFEHSDSWDDEIGHGQIEIDSRGIISITTFCCMNEVDTQRYQWRGKVLKSKGSTTRKATDD